MTTTASKAKEFQIDDAILEQLRAEADRTGLGPNKLLRYMRNRKLLPPNSNLKVALMESWLTGLSTKARREDVDAIFTAYAEIAPEAELSASPEGNQLIVICPTLQKELSDKLSPRANSCRRAMLMGPDTPNGLTEYRMRRLSNGHDQTIRADHLTHIRKHSGNHSV